MNTVLVVEDEADIRDLFVAALQEFGYRAIPAENGQAALEILRTMGREPCLVLLDMMMPVMNGREFLEALENCHKVASLPVVVVSAYPGSIADDRVRKIVKKPISPDGLKRVVDEFCRDTPD